MANLWWGFQACGWPSLLSSLAALAAFVLSGVAVVAALTRARAAVPLSWAALAVALLPAGVGAAGVAFGRSKINRLINEGFVDPTQLERIRAEGYREASACLDVGVAFTVLPLLLALVAFAAAYALRAPPPSERVNR